MQRNEANRTFLRFVAKLPPKVPVCVLGHSDTDGLAAAAILARAFRALGFRVQADVTRKGESAWSQTTLQRLARHQPAALAICDLGSRNHPLLPGIPALLVDHHRPTGIPPNGTLLTAYGDDSPATSGLLAYWCAEAVHVEGIDWIAAVSILADLGGKVAFPEWISARKKYGSATLREIATLLNSPRRASAGDATVALDLLLRAADPVALLADPAVEQLRAARTEYETAMAVGRRAAPRFAGTVALITINTPCQVHPALAQMWIGRLHRHIVICANQGYLPGRVNFSVRSRLKVDLIEFLSRHKPAEAGEEFAQGHDRATGGSLSLAQWNEFLRLLGFAASPRLSPNPV